MCRVEILGCRVQGEGWRARGLLSSEYGTCETFKDRFWPWLLGRQNVPKNFQAVLSLLGRGTSYCVSVCQFSKSVSIFNTTWFGGCG